MDAGGNSVLDRGWRLAFSKDYWVVLDSEVEFSASLRGFAVLSPVLAAYSY